MAKEGADGLKAKLGRADDKSILSFCAILGQFLCLHTSSSCWGLRGGDPQSLSEGSGFKIRYLQGCEALLDVV